MSNFKSIDDFAHRTEAPLDPSHYDSLDAWVNSSRDGVRIMDSGQCIEVNTIEGARALRDWLTEVIGDKS